MLPVLFFIVSNTAFAYDNRYESTITSDYIEWDNWSDYFYVNWDTNWTQCLYSQTIESLHIIQENTAWFWVICSSSFFPDNSWIQYFTPWVTDWLRTSFRGATWWPVTVLYENQTFYMHTWSNAARSMNLIDWSTASLHWSSTYLTISDFTASPTYVNWIDSNTTSTNPNLICETKPLNFPYKTSYVYDSTTDLITYTNNRVDELYKLEYTKWNNLNTITILNWENLSIINPWYYTFDSLESPFNDNPSIILESETSTINYLKLDWSWTQATLQKCEPNPVWTWNIKVWDPYFLDFSDTYNSFEYWDTKCLIITFEKSYTDSNIVMIDWGVKDIQIIDSEVCYDPTDDTYITVNGETMTWSLIEQIKNDWTVDDDNIWYDPNKLKENLFTGFDEWNIELWIIQNPINEANWTCTMFNENWNFTYYSNWQVSFNITLDSFEFLDFWLVDLRSYWNKFLWVITSPINTVISLVWIITPFWEDSREYCIFWTIMTYDNHKLFKNWPLYNQMNFFTYICIFALYLVMLKIALKYRKQKDVTPNQE